MIVFWLSFLVAAADPITVDVTGSPLAQLQCAGAEPTQYDASAPIILDPAPAGPCAVALALPAGEADLPGRWRCEPTGCTKTETLGWLEIDGPANTLGVGLDCGQGTLIYGPTAVEGAQRVTLNPAPAGACKVSLLTPVGEVPGPGRWACGPTGCADGGPGPEVRITLAPGVRATSLHLQCDAGYDKLSPVTDSKVLFEGVPNGDCTVHFKGGPPAKYRPLRRGAWLCKLEGSVAVCQPDRTGS